MTEEYASMKQIEFMKKLGFPPQSADLLKSDARRMIDAKLKEDEKAPVEGHDEVREIVTSAVDKVVGAKAKEEDPLAFQIRSREVRCRALECAIATKEIEASNPNYEFMLKGMAVLEIADKFVEWING